MNKDVKDENIDVRDAPRYHERYLHLHYVSADQNKRPQRSWLSIGNLYVYGLQFGAEDQKTFVCVFVFHTALLQLCIYLLYLGSEPLMYTIAAIS